MPYCRQGILAGMVLSFARALGEYGATSMVAGYTPGTHLIRSCKNHGLRKLNKGFRGLFLWHGPHSRDNRPLTQNPLFFVAK